MKIALLGYGRMGKEIEKHAKKRNHQISFILDKEFQEGEINDSDVAINFSIPEAAVSNIKLALGKIFLLFLEQQVGLMILIR